MARARFDGIDGVTGSDVIQAVVSLGIKNPSGWPVEREYFHIVVPHEVDGRRKHDPLFDAFNNAPPEKRTVMHGVLLHGSMRECFEWYRLNMVGGKGKMHPDKRPFCRGDGINAERWMEDRPDHFDMIACPNTKCEYHQYDSKGVQPCKPFIRFLFQIYWPKNSPFYGLPTPPVKFVSKSWYTTNNFFGREKIEDRVIRKGFFGQILNIAERFNLEDSLFAIPFTMKVVMRKKQTRGAVFPTVHIAPDVSLPAFFLSQQREFRELLGSRPVTSLLTPPENTDAVIAADWRSVSVTSDIVVPAKYEEPAPASDLVQVTRPSQAEKSKYEPMPLNELGKLARLDEIPPDKLPRFVYDACVHHGKQHEMRVIESYNFMYGGEDNEGKAIKPAAWEEVKRSPELLAKYAKKAKMFVENFVAEAEGQQKLF